MLYTDLFDTSLKKLLRKYSKAKKNVVDLISEVEKTPGIGTSIPGYGTAFDIYKIRGALKSYSIGKSGGLRLIYFYDNQDILLLFIYAKREMNNEPKQEILKWLSGKGFLESTS